MNRQAFAIVRAGVVAVTACVGLTPIHAQEPPEAPQRGVAEGRGAGEGRSAGEGRGGVPDVVALQELLDSYVLMQAQRQLQLTPDQAPPFIVRLRELQQTRRRAFRQRAAIIQDLRRLTQSARGRPGDVDATQIADRLRSLDDVDARSAGEVKQAMANLDQVLDPYQRARFRILEEQLERNKVDILLRARRGRGNQER
jgi:hypothetical protein